MPDLMQYVCATHPELTVCASLAPAPDLRETMDQAYDNLILWLGGLGPHTFWVLTAVALAACVVCPLLFAWTAQPGITPT
jgi:hypothetical protein